MPRRLVSAPDRAHLSLVAKVRVIYGDTDKMGFVYHGTYLRYLEHGRVEAMRALGATYSVMERGGFGLPVTDLAVTYHAPARYDDLVSVYVGLSRVSMARVYFDYELAVEPGDRHELEERVVVLHARTQHGCMSLAEGRAARIPEEMYEVLAQHVMPAPEE